MAEYMLLRMVVAGVAIGMFVPTIVVGQMMHAVWHPLHQRRENHV